MGSTLMRAQPVVVSSCQCQSRPGREYSSVRTLDIGSTFQAATIAMSNEQAMEAITIIANDGNVNTLVFLCIATILASLAPVFGATHIEQNVEFLLFAAVSLLTLSL